MEVNEAITKRRSIRKFSNKEVEDALINKIINVKRLASSTKNR